MEHGGTKKTVFRNYKDLVWLHKMAQKLELGGNIVRNESVSVIEYSGVCRTVMERVTLLHRFLRMMGSLPYTAFLASCRHNVTYGITVVCSCAKPQRSHNILEKLRMMLFTWLQ